MSCAICGEDCRCEPGVSASGKPARFEPEDCDSASWIDPDAFEPTEQHFELSLDSVPAMTPGRFVPETDDAQPALAARQGEPALTAPAPMAEAAVGEPETSPTSVGTTVESTPDHDPDYWRREIADRLQSYRSRRKLAEPRYPSLQLQFESFDSPSSALWEPPAAPSMAIGSLALESAAAAAVAPETPVPPALEPTNVIVFPRYEVSAPAPWSELADPVVERPRIVEVPDLLPPQPALGGITLTEPDTPPALTEETLAQPASLLHRILAAALDGACVLVATLVFGFVAWKLAAALPPFSVVARIVGITAIFFWFAYQYLFLVYTGKTIGMQLCQLELCRFDGSPTSAKTRRLRVLSSALSGGAVLLGYVWALLDPDSLCWHDRITRTYIRIAREN